MNRPIGFQEPAMGGAREVRTGPRQASDEVFASGSKKKARRYSQIYRRRLGTSSNGLTARTCGNLMPDWTDEQAKRNLFASIAKEVRGVTNYRDHKIMDTCKINYRLPYHTSKQTGKIAEHRGAVITRHSFNLSSTSFLKSSHARVVRTLLSPENKSPYLSICSCRTMPNQLQSQRNITTNTHQNKSIRLKLPFPETGIQITPPPQPSLPWSPSPPSTTP
jgi:hypothetical protein